MIDVCARPGHLLVRGKRAQYLPLVGARHAPGRLPREALRVGDYQGTKKPTPVASWRAKGAPRGGGGPCDTAAPFPRRGRFTPGGDHARNGRPPAGGTRP